MRPYADTNFFTRLYLPLEESRHADGLLTSAQSEGAQRLPIVWLHRVELVNALQLHVFVGKRAGHVRVTIEQAGAAWESFRTDVADANFLASARLPEPAIEQEVEKLALRHTAKRGFRTYDLLHVAHALLLGCDEFWSFDERASELARLEGFRVSRARRP